MKKHLCISKVGIIVTLLLTAVMAHAFSVNIDIKPWSCPNAINPNSNGVVPVAILTSIVPAFDASTVDAATVRFAGPGEPGAYDTDGIGRMEDADGDGDLDMVLHFVQKETGIEDGDTYGIITGETYGGDSFVGYDGIMTVPR